MMLDSKDLVTHAVCVGMTGSGKTGLCVGLLEEAAIDGIPALIIDPKGDLSNLLLTFPQLSEAEFAPWVSEEEARRQGLTVEQLAKATADKWKKGLESWGQDGERVRRLREAADFTIYTPGSTAGLPVSVLRSFSVPSEELRDDREAFRERIQSTATAILALLNFAGDPVQSREHILISTLLQNAWSKEQDLDLAGLIQQIQKPPVTRIGVMEMEAFFPAKERFDLAVQLNNLLASPGFEAWLEGDPLDISNLLYTSQGKPRITIFSINHLADSERMFFVSLLLNQVVSWMRTQKGTTSLRALLYMDEIFGYFPPIANPPSKQPLLTLLKQARAFGLGVVLATQNPVDLDYKGLANCGTWFIGRLQTEQDKKRLLEGLQGAATASGGNANMQALEQLLSSLKQRIFMMNNVHRGIPEVFETRWALSYLSGPVTKAQIRALMKEKKTGSANGPVAGGGNGAAGTLATAVAAGQSAAGATAGGASAGKAAASAAEARPVLPPEIPQFFLPYRGSGNPSYTPVLYGSADVRFTDTKTKVDVTQTVRFLTPIGGGAVAVDWTQGEPSDIEAAELEHDPASNGASYGPLPEAAGKAKNYTAWQKEFTNFLFANQKLELLKSPSSGKVSEPGESERDFRVRLTDEGHELRDAAVEDLRKRYSAKLMALEEKIRKAEMALEKEQQQASSQKWQTGLSIATGILGAVFGGGRSTATKALGMAGKAATGVGRSAREGQDVERAEENLQAVQEQKAALEAELKQEVDELQARFDTLNEQFEAISVAPKKTNIAVKLVCLAWKPE